MAACCDLLAHASIRIPVEALPEWRRKPGALAGQAPAPSFLKNADEQTVAGLAAVYRAIDAHGLEETRFTEWGVLAAPQFFGRTSMVAALQRFEAEGAWGVSPHLAAHHSQHAVSGTISQALKIHGPNFGIGGGPGSAGEAVLAAVALLARQPMPGAWLILTGWDPGLTPDRSGKPQEGSVCVGLALALGPSRLEWQGPRVIVSARNGHGEPNPPETTTPFELFSLEGYLESRSQARKLGLKPVQPLRLDAGHRMEVTLTPGVRGPGLAVRTQGSVMQPCSRTH